MDSHVPHNTAQSSLEENPRQDLFDALRGLVHVADNLNTGVKVCRAKQEEYASLLFDAEKRCLVLEDTTNILSEKLLKPKETVTNMPKSNGKMTEIISEQSNGKMTHFISENSNRRMTHFLSDKNHGKMAYFFSGRNNEQINFISFQRSKTELTQTTSKKSNSKLSEFNSEETINKLSQVSPQENSSQVSSQENGCESISPEEEREKVRNNILIEGDEVINIKCMQDLKTWCKENLGIEPTFKRLYLIGQFKLIAECENYDLKKSIMSKRKLVSGVKIRHDPSWEDHVYIQENTENYSTAIVSENLLAMDIEQESESNKSFTMEHKKLACLLEAP